MPQLTCLETEHFCFVFNFFFFRLSDKIKHLKINLSLYIITKNSLKATQFHITMMLMRFYSRGYIPSIFIISEFKSSGRRNREKITSLINSK